MAVKKKTVKKKVAKKVAKKSGSPKSAGKKVVIKKKAPKKMTFMTDKDIAMDFAAQVHKRFDHILKASVLFGSQARGDSRSGSDIDIILIVDDAAIEWDLELVAWYREELAKVISSNEYHKDLHVNTVKLTTWWNDLMHGDPVVINILRYGQALVDIGGFFNPIKALLLKGKIHATPEAVYSALQRAPYHLARSEMAQRKAIEGIYWTMVDSSQAALITLGKLPPSPQHIPNMLDDLFVKGRLLKKEYVEWFAEIFQLHKDIDRGKPLRVKGSDLDTWQERGAQFMARMTEIVDMLLDAKNDNSQNKK